jgi:GNAT superfamily N-acetyltransferase
MSDAAPGTMVTATVTYLAMEAKPSGHSPPRPLLKKVAILQAETPAVHFYRYLYETIGRDYLWVERRAMSDEDLRRVLESENFALYVLYIAGVPAGMAELDFPEAQVGQIAYFGLMPEFIGRRIGPWFLHQAIELAWTAPIGRLRVNTCTLDHKKALAVYQRAGFVPYARGEKTMLVPAELEPFIPDTSRMPVTPVPPLP